MRALHLLVGTCLLVAVPGQAGSARDSLGDRQVTVVLLKPCELSWGEQDSSNIVPLGRGKTGDTTVTLPRAKLTLHADGGTLTEEWHGTANLSAVDTIAPINLQSGVNRMFLGGLLFLVASAAFGVFFAGRARQFRKKIRAAEEEEPLIRSDGQLPRRLVGGYKIVSQLGSGAMGVVYKAVASDGMEVAIKVPAPHLISESQYQERFRREIQLGLKLDHPNVVRLLAMPDGEDAYLVLEYVKGATLESQPRRTLGEEVPRVRRWLAQALEALAYIHSQGIVHRDLKPANLMVLPNDAIKLMDFGIAHKLHGTKLTGTDTILGTPLYMAPEQVQGDKVDERSDLYSLGLIFYERLTGALPYSDDLVEILHSKMSKPLPPLTTVLNRVPPDLDRVITRLTQRKPADRYPDAESARRDLQKP